MLDLMEGKPRVQMANTESEARQLVYLKAFMVKQWPYGFEGERGKGREQIPFEIQWIHIP